MALMKCNECGHQISNEAESCPSCGAKPEKMGFFRKMLIGIVALVAITSIIEAIKSPSVKHPDESTAATEAQDTKKKSEGEQAKKLTTFLLRITALRETMKNPSSFDLTQAIYLENETLCVTYRGTNSFGGVVTESKAISSRLIFVDYEENCSGKTGEDVTYLKKFLKNV